MAIYHLSVKTVGRSGGRSATAAAAYRSAQKIHDRTSGEVFDYTRKRGVQHTEIVLPTSAAQKDINWPRQREQLWNAAEEAEKRKDARVAREYELALPAELKAQQRVDLVRAFALEVANRYGVAVDFAIHRPHREGDARNHHAHVLTTTREITPEGLGAKSSLELSETDRAKRGLPHSKNEFHHVRERWAALTNEALREHGHQARVDHRTLEAQGLERTPGTHKGPAVTALERRGLHTEVGRRLAAEQLAAAQARIEQAAELGRIAHQQAQLRQELIALSTDVTAAKQARDIRNANAKTLTPQERQRQARENWLKYKAEQAEKSKTAGQDREAGKDQVKDQGIDQGIDQGNDYDDDDYGL